MTPFYRGLYSLFSLSKYPGETLRLEWLHSTVRTPHQEPLDQCAHSEEDTVALCLLPQMDGECHHFLTLWPQPCHHSGHSEGGCEKTWSSYRVSCCPVWGWKYAPGSNVKEGAKWQHFLQPRTALAHTTKERKDNVPGRKKKKAGTRKATWRWQWIY